MVCPRMLFYSETLLVLLLLKVKQDVKTLEENKTSFHTIYKGINKEHTSKRRRIERMKTEENQMKGR